mmetsp:Transcript_168151/g.322849  ORF Transcript_168151/g.322849 Transcript_168151/m.322849 type:complete len:293 (-) Transcript_168151:94-972(-)
MPESDCDASSGSDWQGAQWEDIEAEALKALDAKLEAHYPSEPSMEPECKQATPEEAAAAAQARSLQEEVAALDPMAGFEDFFGVLRKACAQEGYKPEEHIRSAEEMWGDLSDSDGEKREAKPRQNPSEVRRDPGEHVPLTVEEMWGDLSDDDAVPDQAGIAQASQQPPAPQRADPMPANLEPTTVLGRLFGVTAEQAAGMPSSSSESFRPPLRSSPDGSGSTAASAGRGVSSSSSSADQAAARLQKVLAGPDAPRLLEKLSFDELTTVADDCMRATETLRWVLQRQRAMAVD